MVMMAVSLSLSITGCSAKEGADDTGGTAASRDAENAGAGDMASQGAEKPGLAGKASREGQENQADGSYTDDDTRKEQAVEHLLTVWSDYLRVYEEINASALWALQYIEVYLDSADWNDLMRARAACIACADDLEELAMTEQDLTEEEYAALEDAGIDTTYQPAEFESVSAYQSDLKDLIQKRLLEALIGDIYLESNIGILGKEASIDKDYINYTGQYCCLTTNYLLLTLKDEERAKAYWSEAQTKYPTLFADAYEWMDEQEILMQKTEAVFADYEEILLALSDTTADLTASLYEMQQIAESKDTEKLFEKAHKMTNVPALLPAPEWYTPEAASYRSFLIEEATETDMRLTFPKPGDELSDGTYGMQIEIENISAEEIAAYMASIEKLVQRTWKSEDSDTWNLIMPDYQVRIVRKGQATTILIAGQDEIFAPSWYIAYCQRGR